MGDIDEDIDTTEIEEDWIEYMKRSTRLAEEKMRTASTMLHYDSQKDEMEIGNEDLFSARDEMVKKQQNGIQASAVVSEQAEQWEDQERDGETTSINSSSLRKQKNPRETI